MKKIALQFFSLSLSISLSKKLKLKFSNSHIWNYFLNSLFRNCSKSSVIGLRLESKSSEELLKPRITRIKSIFVKINYYNLLIVSFSNNYIIKLIKVFLILYIRIKNENMNKFIFLFILFIASNFFFKKLGNQFNIL